MSVSKDMVKSRAGIIPEFASANNPIKIRVAPRRYVLENIPEFFVIRSVKLHAAACVGVSASPRKAAVSS